MSKDIASRLLLIHQLYRRMKFVVHYHLQIFARI